MPTAFFNLYMLTIEPRDDSPYRTFEEMLTNLPVRPVTLVKNKNPFQLEGRVIKRGRLYYGTFCLLQKNEIPQKLKFGGTPEKIMDDDDEGGLGHFTSFIFDPTNNVIAIQNNRNAVSANGIASYFRRNYKVRDVALEIIINPDKLEQLRRMSTISSFSISVAKPQNGSFIDKNSKLSIGEMNSIADETDAKTIQLQLGIGFDRNTSLKKNAIISYVRKLLSSDQPLDVRKIEIKGRETDDDYTDTLDLITNKVSIPIFYSSPRTVDLEFMNGIIRKAITKYVEIKPSIDNTYKVKRRAQ